MSSTIKDMLIRTGAPARLCSSRQRLFKGKYVVMNDLLIGENRSITRLRRGGGAYGVRTCQDRHSSGGFSNISKPPLQNKTRAQTISSSTPSVSDPAPTTTKRVFTFGKGRSEGNKSMKSLLGGKGANLAEMASIGLSVPPGLTVSTEACHEYQQKGKKLPLALWEEILEGLKCVEKDMGAFLGDPSKPLILSVRSGAAISMPGMMDTVLNLGLNDQVVAGLSAKSGERFAYDSFRRFLDMFGNVARWRQEEKAKEGLLMQASVTRKERENIEASAKSKEDMIRLKAETNLQKYKDDIQKLEKEISQLRLKTDSSKIAALRRGIDGSYANRLAGIKSIPAQKESRTPCISEVATDFHDYFEMGGVKRERECVMCLSEEMSVVFLPCAHQVVCTTCNELHEKQGMKDCPSCRGPIQLRVPVRYARS